MFGSFFRDRPAEVFEHWYALIPDFNLSVNEFYQAVEEELKNRKVPGLELRRVQFAAGSILADRREYLRMSRERLVFDVCAAPFGTSYFFSCRFAENAIAVKSGQLLALMAAVGLFMLLSFFLCAKVLGGLTFILWPLGWLVTFMFLFMILRNAKTLGTLDSILLNSSVGSIYGRWFRRETYYRQDTRLMYCDTVNDVVKAKVEEVTGAKGIKLLRFNENRPILGELYQPRVVQLPKPE